MDRGDWRERLDSIREHRPIVDVLSTDGGVYLEQRGKEWVARCPFHDDATPSFTVTPSTGLFYCFGCHVGGDVFTWLEMRNGIGFSEAVRLLESDMRVEQATAYGARR